MYSDECDLVLSVSFRPKAEKRILGYIEYHDSSSRPGDGATVKICRDPHDTGGSDSGEGKRGLFAGGGSRVGKEAAKW